MNSNILLESGTGEVEILEFVIKDKHYAINVIKVKEVIEIDNLTKLPETPDEIAGLILSRDEILTLVDLKYILEKEKCEKIKSKIIVCEFNKLKVAFNIDDIVAVHRVKWEEIRKPDDVSANSLIIGNIVKENKIILLLDFEKIVTDISPKTGISVEKISSLEYKERENIKIILADDSFLIRKLLQDTLTKAGFRDFKIFNDGKEVLEYLIKLSEKKKERFIEEVQILITDIEMPQMDGYTLTRRIKEHPILKKLPVIIFSSLITEELKHKGEAVKADAQLSKPDINKLVETIDKYI